LPGYGSGSSRNRNNSMNDAMLRGSGAGSPTNSRPRTPSHPPSSEVTPWVYQDPQVSVGG
jgi:adenylate cyclase